MDTLTVHNTYGRALFDAANDRGKIYEIAEEYRAVREIFETNPALKKLFLLPTIPVSKKKEVAGEVFGDRISPELLSFICILIDKRRICAFDGIGGQYEKLVLERDGLTKGLLYSVLPVGEDRLAAFEAKAGAVFGKKVKLENRLDASLIGGVKIYVDGKLIDASVKSRLEQLKQRIAL